MAWRDLTDVLGATKSKELPIQGRQVAFPGTISAWAGQLLLAIRRAAVEQRDAGSPEDTAELVLASGLATEADAERLEAELLGDGAAVLEELGVIGDARNHVVQTLMVWHLSGQEAAELVWEGKAGAPNRAAKRAAGRSSKTAGTARGRSTAGAGASSARPAATVRGRRSSSTTGRS